MSSGVLSVLILFFSLLFLHFICVHWIPKKYTIGSNERMKPLFVNFFSKMKKNRRAKKSFHLFFVVIIIVFILCSFIQLRFALVSSCLCTVCVFFITLWFSHMTGHEKSTKLTHPHWNAHTYIRLVHRSFIDMRVVYTHQ